jgi:hypothetical protein
MGCGKRSQDRNGPSTFNEGWDASCFLNAELFETNRLEIEKGLVVCVYPKR